jgi:hypothetical protein
MNGNTNIFDENPYYIKGVSEIDQVEREDGNGSIDSFG